MRGGALVTGAGLRIGRALALAAARCGYDVVIHHRSHHAEAESAVAEIEALGRKAVAIAGDLADPETPGRLVAEAAAAVGPLTLLVNNASTFVDDRVGAMAREAWDAQLAVNLAAPVFLAQAFAAQADPGRDNLIVNLTDQRVWKPNPQFFSYTVSKLALWNATRTLAQALAPSIRVNAIGPGPTLASVYQTPERFAAEARATPLGRRAEVADIAAALLYLIDARAVTGQMIAVDGGQHLGWKTPDILDD
jgi:NAD(P)-dependent dehydrogenase (short-subunit alcohol dehydrogenase family)